MIAIIDYGVGNLFSLHSSLKAIGVDAVVTGDADIIRSAQALILPGVGAFEDAAKKLFESGLANVIKEEVERNKPLLGICLGMQMLFEKSHEYGEHAGLGFLKGSVVPMYGKIPSELNIPHMGWNSLIFKKKSKLFKYINDGDFAYFVHSYYADCDYDEISSVSEYGAVITASVEKDNVYGCQFHPEKSGKTGLAILRAFSELGEEI